MKGKSMSQNFTRQTSLVARPCNRRRKIVVKVLYQAGDDLIIEQLEVPDGETTMSVMRSRGHHIDSYSDIEIEAVGKIEY